MPTTTFCKLFVNCITNRRTEFYFLQPSNVNVNRIPLSVSFLNRFLFWNGNHHSFCITFFTADCFMVQLEYFRLSMRRRQGSEQKKRKKKKSPLGILSHLQGLSKSSNFNLKAVQDLLQTTLGTERKTDRK